MSWFALREVEMEQSEVMERVVKILTPWVKDEGALAGVSMETISMAVSVTAS